MAQQAMPRAHLEVCEAGELDTNDRYDIVLSQGVFLYFPNLEYAAATLLRMVKKARKAVAVLDVPDLAKRDQALALRQKALGTEAYAAKYSSLDHLYFAKDWFLQTLRGPESNVTICDQDIEGYFNNGYRFNVFIRSAPPCPPGTCDR